MKGFSVSWHLYWKNEAAWPNKYKVKTCDKHVTAAATQIEPVKAASAPCVQFISSCKTYCGLETKSFYIGKKYTLFLLVILQTGSV